MKLWIAITQNHAVAESLRTAISPGSLFYIEPDVEAALRRMISVRPDAVIVDEGPQLGREAIKQLNEHVPGVPLVALTSRPQADVHASYIMAGVQSVVNKPFQYEKLVNTLQSLPILMDGPAAVTPPLLPSVSEGPARAERHRAALRWLARATSMTENPQELGRRLCEAAVDLFDATRGALFLHVDGATRIIASHNLQETVRKELTLDYSAGILRRFELDPTVVDRAVTPVDNATNRQMDILGATLALPLIVYGQTCGTLLLGDKADGTPYSPEDRETLLLLVRGAAGCLEQIHRHRKATQQQEQLDALLANVNSGVIAIDAQRRVTMLNSRAKELLNVSSSETIGQSIQKLGSALADIVIRTLNDRKPRLRQTIFDTATQTELGLSVTPLNHDGAVVVFTRLKNQETQTNEDPAHSPIWRYLSSRVAQEIKNPMVAINIFAQLLPSHHDSSEFRDEFAKVVQSEVERINGVVETLYEFARNPRLVRKPEDLNTRIEQCLHRFDEVLKERQVKIEMAFSEKPISANLDAERFDEAFAHVIQNSIDALPQGGTIRIRTQQKNGTCEAEISDTGNGIAEQDVPHIFTPFFSTKETGMGLGLTFARRIVEEHEGKLDAAAPSDAGSRFVFHLPASTIEAPKQ